LWSAFWIGVIVGSLMRGKIDPGATDFMTAYVDPWFGPVPLATGIMTICIFGFLAAVYLVGETDDPELKAQFWRRGFGFNVGVVLSGGLVFLVSYIEQAEFVFRFVVNPVALAMVCLATILFFALWYFVRRNRSLWVRLIGAGQIALILLGWYVVTAPDALQTVNGPLSFYDAAAPEATLRQLTWALCVGSIFIFPSLGFLLRVFKR
jgi:cytochrome d ubiquinol oxidase subunit II